MFPRNMKTCFRNSSVERMRNTGQSVSLRIMKFHLHPCTPTGGPGWRSRYSDSIHAGRSRDRIPVEVRFSTPALGPAKPPMQRGTMSFPGVKRPRRGLDHPPPSSAEVKERVNLCFYSPSEPSWPILGWTLPLPYQLVKFSLTRRIRISFRKLRVCRVIKEFVENFRTRRFIAVLQEPPLVKITCLWDILKFTLLGGWWYDVGLWRDF